MGIDLKDQESDFITFAPIMIAYLKGEITYKTPTLLVVETGGVGYHVHISLNTYSQIEGQEKVQILIHSHIKEDSHTLYGFAEESERQLFKHLLSVSGIGPNSARVILSGMTPEETREAILGENVPAFQRIKGIGPKTAKRVILDLKDKVARDSGSGQVLVPKKGNTLREEALSALVALGFKSSQVQSALTRVLAQKPGTGTVEELIKEALKQLS